MKMESENPKIICFMCNWTFCREELQIPSNVNVARVMCIGRIDPVIVLDAFANGVDGVMLVGCKPPDCHYIEGNLQAERAVKMLKKLVALTGLEPERLKLLWVSPLEENDFNSHVDRFCEEIKGFNSSKLENKRLIADLSAAKSAASDFRLRVLLGREKELTEEVNAYGEKISQEEFEALIDEIVQEEFIRHKIYLLTKTEPLSVKALAENVGVKPAAVLRQIVNMRRKNMIALDHVEGTTPLYKALEVK